MIQAAHYKDLCHQDTNDKFTGMRALTKKKIMGGREVEPSPTKIKRADSSEQGIERALIQPEEIDLMYRKSAEKNMFELNREQSSSFNSNLSGSKRKPSMPVFEDAYGMNQTNMEYDLNNIFNAANDMMTSGSKLLSREKNNRTSFMYSREDEVEMSRLQEVSVLLDKYKQELEDKFVTSLKSRKSHPAEISFVNVPYIGVLSREEIEAQFEQPAEPIQTHRYNDRKLIVDESTFLPMSSTKAERGLDVQSDMNASRILNLTMNVNDTIDWNRYKMDHKEEEEYVNDDDISLMIINQTLNNETTLNNTFLHSRLHDGRMNRETDRSLIIEAIITSAKKNRQQLDGTNGEEEQQRYMPNTHFDMNAYNNRLSTVIESLGDQMYTNVVDYERQFDPMDEYRYEDVDLEMPSEEGRDIDSSMMIAIHSVFNDRCSYRGISSYFSTKAETEKFDRVEVLQSMLRLASEGKVLVRQEEVLVCGDVQIEII